MDSRQGGASSLVHFTYPDIERKCSAVSVTGTFNNWAAPGVPCTRGEDGVWRVAVRVAPGSRLLYKFILDGKEWTFLPSHPHEADADGNINNVVTAPALATAAPSSATAAGAGGYIGAGALRELHEEFQLTPGLGGSSSASTRGAASIVRSATISDVTELAHTPLGAVKGSSAAAGSAPLHHHHHFHALSGGGGGGGGSGRGLGPAAAAAASAGSEGGASGEGEAMGMPLDEAPSLAEPRPTGAAAPAAVSSPPSAGGPPQAGPRPTSLGGPARPIEHYFAPNGSVLKSRPESPAVVPSPGSSSSSAAHHGGASAASEAGSEGSAGGSSAGSSSSAAAPVSTGGAGSVSGVSGGSHAHGGPSLLTPTSGAPAAAAAAGLVAPQPLPAPSTALTSVQASVRREGKTVVAMVGLPGRGKTFTGRHLKRHLNWLGVRSDIYNVGNYRRKHLGAHQSAAFFDPSNKEGEAARREVAQMAFDEMTAALAADLIDVAIFDATNSTHERRRWLRESLAAKDPRYQLIFIESICRDESVIHSNVRETKLKSPDYTNTPEAEAVADFLRRIAMYEKVYQELDDEHEGSGPYIKIIDVGRQVIANRIQGFLPSRISFFLSNLHITPRPIWLTRHGESQFNVQGRIGGDSLLSPRGQAYAARLATFMSQQYPASDDSLQVWTSTLRRTGMTAAPLGRQIIQWKALDEIDAGVCDGMTYEAIAAVMPDEYAARSRSKYTYRYPRGESYQDIVHRLEPVIIELMRQRGPVMIVSHQATLRVLYAYLTDKPPESCPELLVPLHTVIQLTPKAYGCEEVRHELL